MTGPGEPLRAARRAPNFAILVYACLAPLACAPSPRPVAGPPAAAARSEVVEVRYTVADLDRVRAFLEAAVDATVVDTPSIEEPPSAPGAASISGARSVRLAIGDARLVLTEYTPDGRPIPDGSRSDDLWFEHVAIVVSDIDRAHVRVMEAGAAAISTDGVVRIPESNAAAAGIRAFYFRDPEGHPLELIWFPEGKGDPRWQARDRLFLGIDHTAIGAADTERTARFYEDVLSLHVAGGSTNDGPYQAALTGVDGAAVRITGLRGAAGIGVELLDYLSPTSGRPAPADTTLQDQWHWEIVVASPAPAEALRRARAAGAVWAESDAGPWLLQDPDGHVVRLEPR